MTTPHNEVNLKIVISVMVPLINKCVVDVYRHDFLLKGSFKIQ